MSITLYINNVYKIKRNKIGRIEEQEEANVQVQVFSQNSHNLSININPWEISFTYNWKNCILSYTSSYPFNPERTYFQK